MHYLNKKTKEQLVCKLYQGTFSGPELSATYGMPLREVYKILDSWNIPRKTKSEQNFKRLIGKDPSFTISRQLTLEQQKLMVAALMLYCAEGAKIGNTVDFANSSPLVLKVFLRFLQEVCQINPHKLRLYLYCFEDQDQKQLIDFWCKELRVQIYHFTKPYVRKRSAIHTRTMEHGVLHIRYSDKLLLEKILILIDDRLKQLTE